MEDLKEIVKSSFSMNDMCIKLYGYTNGHTIKKANKLIEENGLDISHFGLGKKNIKYKKINKTCPICEKKFETKSGHRDEKTTCSQVCANYYFLHGKNNPNFDTVKYKEMYEKVSKKIKNNLLSIIENKIKSDDDSKSTDINYYKPLDTKKYKRCKNCDCEFVLTNKSRIFCSNYCRGQYPVSDKTREKISLVVRNRIQNGLHKGWQSRNIESYPEKFFKKVLENNNIEYEFNKLVIKKDIGIEEVGNYFLDFYIEKGNIDLEIDGNQHKYRKEHDNKRDEQLSNKFNVYRIEWKSINNEKGKEYIKNEIDKFIKYYNNMTNLIQQTQQQQITPTD